MKKPFSKSEASSLINEHRQILSDLCGISTRQKQIEEYIMTAVDAIQGSAAMEEMSKIATSNIDFDKKRIRISALIEHGYKTAADLYHASWSRLNAIDGIGEDSIFAISGTVRKMYDSLKKRSKIKISLDNQTDDYSRLVRCLVKDCMYLQLLKKTTALVEANQQQIVFWCNYLQTNLGGLNWLFSPSGKQEKIAEAYQGLANLKKQEYYTAATGYLDTAKQIDSYKNDMAWQLFAKKPMLLYHDLERLCPDILGADDLYGLPADFAKNITSTPLSLDGFKCELRRYQVLGVRYILHQVRVLLGDEMGLGKTVQAIASMVSLRNSGKTHFLVVCPASIMINWQREIEEKSDLRAVIVHSSGREKAFADWLRDGGVAIATYNGTAMFTTVPNLDMMIVDEAHFVKNPDAGRTKRVVEIAKHTEYLLFMTGTALENRVEEMVNLIRILNPNIAQILLQERNVWNSEQFKHDIVSVYYRRRRVDVLPELPELIESREWCSLRPEEYDVYVDSILTHRQMDARRVSWSVSTLALSSKAERMMEIIQEAADENRKILIFSFFLDTIHKIADMLGDRCVGVITGSVSPNGRQEIIDEFEKAPDGSVLLLQIMTGGFGLNIQAASVVILCEPQLKPSTENQAISRAYRMTQTRNVFVHRLLALDTVDERITTLLEQKQQEFDLFADTSVAGMEDLKISDATFAEIMKAEETRLKQKAVPADFQ